MRKSISLLLFLLISISVINADKTLNLFKSDYKVLNIGTTEVDSITFDNNSASMLIFKKDTTTYVPVEQIDSINFSDGIMTKTPVVKTNSITMIDYDKIRIGMKILTPGGTSVTEKGFCWSTTRNPTTSSQKLAADSLNDVSGVIITGLKSNTDYYIRSYARNSSGLVYGNQMSFTTKNPLPIVNTISANYQQTIQGIYCLASVGYQGNSDIIERGICWSTNENPTINDYKKQASSLQANTFSLTSDSVNIDNDYYVRAYATNSYGTAYGQAIKVVPALGKVTYTLASSVSAANMGTANYNLLKAALDEACYYMSKYTGYNANIWISYNTGVPTAQANYWGQIEFGSNNRYMYVGTVLHEMHHYFGSGTTQVWKNLVSGGKFTGAKTTALIKQLTNGVTTSLSADSQHFWPYGCNQREELSNLSAADQKKYKIIMAKIIWEMHYDCSGWRIK
jgi:hypothetical protein